MTMRKILLCFGFIALAVRPGFAAERICSPVQEWLSFDGSSLPDPVVNSYKATGKIYFLKECPDKGRLCKTGSYIIAGDYFLAIPKANNYYCAAYIPKGYKHPKAIGLIKNENFAETKFSEYDVLQWGPNGNRGEFGKWKSKEKGAEKYITYNGYTNVPGGERRLFADSLVYHPAKSNKSANYQFDNPNDYEVGRILKTGPSSFIAYGCNYIFDMKLRSGKLILTDYGIDRNSNRAIFSGKYTYEKGTYESEYDSESEDDSETGD